MAASFAMIICAMGAAYVLMTRKRRQFNQLFLIILIHV